MSELKTVGDCCRFLASHGLQTSMLDDNLFSSAQALEKIIKNSTPNAEIKILLDYVKVELTGIDRLDCDEGYWETSTGVEFGAARLKAICKLFDALIKPNGE